MGVPRHILEERKKKKEVAKRTKKAWQDVEQVIGPKFILELAKKHFEKNIAETGGIAQGFVVTLDGKKTMVVAPKLDRTLFWFADKDVLMAHMELYLTDKAASMHFHDQEYVGRMRQDVKHAKSFGTPMMTVAKKNMKIAIPRNYGDKTEGRYYKGVPEGKVVHVKILPDKEVWRLIKSSRKYKRLKKKFMEKW